MSYEQYCNRIAANKRDYDRNYYTPKGNLSWKLFYIRQWISKWVRL